MGTSSRTVGKRRGGGRGSRRIERKCKYADEQVLLLFHYIPLLSLIRRILGRLLLEISFSLKSSKIPPGFLIIIHCIKIGIISKFLGTGRK